MCLNIQQPNFFGGILRPQGKVTVQFPDGLREAKAAVDTNSSLTADEIRWIEVQLLRPVEDAEALCRLVWENPGEFSCEMMVTLFFIQDEAGQLLKMCHALLILECWALHLGFIDDSSWGRVSAMASCHCCTIRQDGPRIHRIQVDRNHLTVKLWNLENENDCRTMGLMVHPKIMLEDDQFDLSYPKKETKAFRCLRRHLATCKAVEPSVVWSSQTSTYIDKNRCIVDIASQTSSLCGPWGVCCALQGIQTVWGPRMVDKRVSCCVHAGQSQYSGVWDQQSTILYFHACINRSLTSWGIQNLQNLNQFPRIR